MVVLFDVPLELKLTSVKSKNEETEDKEMGIAAGMKAITQDIVSSHEDRIRKIGEIREEVNPYIL